MVPTVRPSANTSIFAPARCGVEPLARTTVTSAAALAARERIGGGGQDLFVQIEDLDLGLLLQRGDELVRLGLLLLVR